MAQIRTVNYFIQIWVSFHYPQEIQGHLGPLCTNSKRLASSFLWARYIVSLIMWPLFLIPCPHQDERLAQTSRRASILIRVSWLVCVGKIVVCYINALKVDFFDITKISYEFLKYHVRCFKIDLIVDMDSPCSFNTMVAILMRFDNVISLYKSRAFLQRLPNKLYEFCTSPILDVNFSKTKIMIFGCITRK